MTRFKLEGLEPDNPLGFLALLGVMRALEAADGATPERPTRPRAAWSLEDPPLRPVLQIGPDATRAEMIPALARGVAELAADHEFGGRPGLDYPAPEARAVLLGSAREAARGARGRADLVSALMTDAAIKDAAGAAPGPVDPTPLCLMFGQGHQHFLNRLSEVPRDASPPPKGRNARKRSAEECLEEALFSPWHRSDDTFSFRWDAEEDVRYALMAGDPTIPEFHAGTQHGANRLAAVGLAALTVVPERRRGRVRPAIPGGAWDRQGFSFAWPVWGQPATLAAIRSLLAHPDLRLPGGLAFLGVNHVWVARRISTGKYLSFTRGRPDVMGA